MKLPKELTTVTLLSKTLAFIMFTTMPIIGFFLGMQYQQNIDIALRQQMEINPFVSPTPTPVIDTTNWKTYTNLNGKYSFKYPPNYSVQQYNSQKIIIRNKETDDMINPTTNTVNLPNNFVDIFIETQNNREGLSTDTIINNQYIQPLARDPYAKGSLQELRDSLKDYKNGNISGKYMLFGGETFSPTVIQAFKDRIYIFTNHPYQTGNETTALSNKIFDQIIQTFKFTDQISPTTTNPEGKPCGGFAGETGEFACPAGYTCQYPKPMYPDAQGKCIKK